MGAGQPLEATAGAKIFATSKSSVEAVAPAPRYDVLTRFLHWTVAAGIICTLIVGYALHLVSNDAAHVFIASLNMSVATVIAPLMVFRLIWRFLRHPLPQADHLADLQKMAALVAHATLYLIIFCVLISGFLMLKHSFMFFGFVEFPRPVQNNALNDVFFIVHRTSCIVLVGLLGLHLAAVFKHQKIDKYPVLSRMM